MTHSPVTFDDKTLTTRMKREPHKVYGRTMVNIDNKEWLHTVCSEINSLQYHALTLTPVHVARLQVMAIYIHSLNTNKTISNLNDIITTIYTHANEADSRHAVKTLEAEIISIRQRAQLIELMLTYFDKDFVKDCQNRLDDPIDDIDDE